MQPFNVTVKQTVPGIQVRGTLIVASEATRITDSDATSITAFGHKSMPWSPRVNQNVATDYAEEVLVRYKDPRDRVRVLLQSGPGLDEQRLIKSLALGLDDRITIVDGDTGIDKDFWIEGIEHRVLEAGKWLETIFTCEEVAGTAALGTALILDDATDGKLGTGTLAF
jgi:hypothetical protein